jgi:iron complex outermembrane receptor protein
MATVLSVLARPAHSQSMDYGALQDLFGEPVTTSAIGTPQRARDVPADMEIVTADDIRRSGAVDLPGVFEHVAGVDVQRWTNFGADVSVRGYDGPFSPRLLVLINGRQVYSDDYGRTEWAALPVELSEIRQIEIVKGPNSALFGFNAAGGVINIITYDPRYDDVNTASVRGGTQGYRDGSAVATARTGDVAVRLSAGGTQSDDFSDMRAIAAANNLSQSFERNHVGVDAHWSISADSDFELEATHGADQRLAETSVWLPAYPHTAMNSLRGRYTEDTNIGVISASAYTNWSDFAATIGGDVTSAAFRYANVLTVATLQDVFKPSADHTIRLSAEYRHSEMNTSPVGGAQIDYDIGSLSGMWNWDVLPTLSLTAATRVDELWLGRSGEPLPGSGLNNQLWSKQTVEPSYNLGAVWRASNTDTLRLTVARGVQLPSLIEYGGLQSEIPGFFGASGSPEVRPSVVNNYELDWDHSLPGSNVQVRTAVFYETTSNLPTIVMPLNVAIAPGGYFLGFPGNVGDSEELGAEFSVKGTLARVWHWGLSYTPRLVRDHFVPGVSPENSGVDFQGSTPHHVVDVSLGWAQGAWEADSFLRFQSSSAGLFTQNAQTFTLVPIGNSVSFDARAAYKFNERFTAALSGQNVLFSTARQTVFGKVQQRLLATLTASF